ncbi:MAG: hypothetical protein GY800_08215 [Planctomycetes bacterium]|nr:hypothetical protein [Planctomycetota bacterium]
MTNGWFQSDKPLWLPEGSIRAVITLMLIGTLCMLLVVNVAYDINKDKFYASLGIIEALAGAAFGYYFNTRNTNGGRSGMTVKGQDT